MKGEADGVWQSQLLNQERYTLEVKSLVVTVNKQSYADSH